jgi:hypothetical protein
MTRRTKAPAKRWTRKDNPKDVARMDAMADAAAKKFLNAVLTYGEIHEHVGDEWVALAKFLEQTTLAYVSGETERRTGAYEDASFMIGLAIGRRLAGGGR